MPNSANHRARLVISAPKKSSGKTRVALGLARSLKNKGVIVQGFKKGPDFIDPLWMSLATGRPARNLDPWMMGKAQVMKSFGRHSQHAAMSLIEGNHGLHDGLDEAGTTAGLARMLKAPVLLVLDVTGMNRGAAACVLGQVKMKPSAWVGGVILNRVKSSRQLDKVIQAIEQHTGVPVLGALPETKEGILERHLGLITPNEMQETELMMQALANAVGPHCDLEKILHLAALAPAWSLAPAAQVQRPQPRMRLGVLRDAAFCFYYADNLEALEQAGAELVYLNSMTDPGLPDLDGLYIGGGFPESFLPELSGNHSLLQAIRQQVKAGLPVYAECGGLVYLSRQATWQGQSFSLLGLLDLEIQYHARPQGHGYLEIAPRSPAAWLKGIKPFRAHEFHYSQVHGQLSGECQYQLSRGQGLGQGQDGILQGNIFASYAHVHAAACPGWAPGLVAWMKGV